LEHEEEELKQVDEEENLRSSIIQGDDRSDIVSNAPKSHRAGSNLISQKGSVITSNNETKE
jgi:hypothetical protein